jgi:hypothetical protein
MTSAVRETNWPRPAERVSPSDLGNILREFRFSMDIDSNATAGRTDFRKFLRFLVASGETL